MPNHWRYVLGLGGLPKYISLHHTGGGDHNLLEADWDTLEPEAVAHESGKR